MTRVAVLQNPDHPAWNAYRRNQCKRVGEWASK